MLDWLIEIDKKLFLSLNSLHNSTWDEIMGWMTAKQSWYPLYGIIIGFIFIKFKKERWLIFISITILITITELVASGFFKPYIGRLRPCHDPTIKALVHTINGACGSMYGYFSAHASNTFGLAGFIFFMLKNDKKYIWITYFLLLWATIISYSRIYVGVHYPLDIMSGGIFGFITSFFIFKLYSILVNKLLYKH